MIRRLFTTDVVGAGLPLHIAAALLGRIYLDTTRGYTAVFQDEPIARHQQFITRRRSLRDSAEYRDVTPEEWVEFEKHFQLAASRSVAASALRHPLRPRTRLHPLPPPPPRPPAETAALMTSKLTPGHCSPDLMRKAGSTNPPPSKKPSTGRKRAQLPA